MVGLSWDSVFGKGVYCITCMWTTPPPCSVPIRWGMRDNSSHITIQYTEYIETITGV